MFARSDLEAICEWYVTGSMSVTLACSQLHVSNLDIGRLMVVLRGVKCPVTSLLLCISRAKLATSQIATLRLPALDADVPHKRGWAL